MILVVLAGAMLSQIAFKDGAAVGRGPVALGQVADLSVLPGSLRRRASGLALMARPARATLIRHRLLASRARALMPALRPWLTEDQAGILQLAPHADVQPVQLIAAGASEPARGASVAVLTRIGLVTIERRGTAVQDARRGERAFVRFADGSVVSARCCR
ncbi:MAG: hypothetical protein JSS55_06375 [Proteobacteria bacterium]|nr:hypothetical protein [Pseudomonadota bacterium]